MCELNIFKFLYQNYTRNGLRVQRAGLLRDQQEATIQGRGTSECLVRLSHQDGIV